MAQGSGSGNQPRVRRIPPVLTLKAGRHAMRSILLYFLGVPIPIVLLLAMCTHHF